MRNSKLSMVATLALASGACAPNMKPAGYAGGTILTVGGAVALGAVASACSGDEDNFGHLVECGGSMVIFGPAGTAAVVTGLVILLVTAMSPGEEKTAGFVEAKPLPPGAAPVRPVPVPTAPAGRPPTGPPVLPSLSSLPPASTPPPASLAFH